MRVCQRRIPFSTPSSPRWKARRTIWSKCCDKLSRRADLTVEWARRTPHVKLVRSKGAFYAHPQLEIPEEDLTFVTDLLKQKHVLVVHGSGFGEKPGTRHIRIVFLPPEPVLSAAYDTMTDFMKRAVLRSGFRFATDVRDQNGSRLRSRQLGNCLILGLRPTV